MISEIKDRLFEMTFVEDRMLFFTDGTRDEMSTVRRRKSSLFHFIFLDHRGMNHRFAAQRLIHGYKQDGSVMRRALQILSRCQTTNVSPQVSMPISRWALRRYVLLLGVPISTAIFYRLSTKYETRRKHRIVLESIGRAIR